MIFKIKDKKIVIIFLDITISYDLTFFYFNDLFLCLFTIYTTNSCVLTLF